MKTLLQALVLALLVISTSSSSTAIDCTAEPISGFAETAVIATATVPWVLAAADHQQPPPPGCCKVCKRGKACGDTCIARDKTCHVGPGCACDG